MYSLFSRFFLFLVIFIILITIIYTPFISSSDFNNSEIIISNNGDLIWPIPGQFTITSPFGYRRSPTGGASSYHSGVDIGAPEGTPLVACFSGNIIYTGFSGAGGFTITISHPPYTASYCHVSPNFIVSVGDEITVNTHIGNVGPRYVYGVIGNPYCDSEGNPTNGATTGPHLHFTLKKDGQAVNPLEYFDI
ncbi:MAG: M23 family metallopeptidase [Clostridia bacterium]|nr:M23 family metallopeptidase [Clostridia bacterium]